MIELTLQANVDTSGVCCLSELNDHILMWSHYADGHQGLCLEFDARNDVPLLGASLPIAYSKEFKRFPLRSSGTDQVNRVLRTKSLEWEYEREWRIIKPSKIRILPSDLGLLRPTEKTGDRLYAFEARSLTGIILGCSISAERADVVRDWIAARRHKLNLYTGRRKPTAYALEITQLT